MNIKKVFINFIIIIILILTFLFNRNLIVYAGTITEYNSINYTIESIVNEKPDFEYDYLSEMIKDVLLQLLKNKKINLEPELKKKYYDCIIKFYLSKTHSDNDFFLPVKFPHQEILKNKRFVIVYDKKNYFISLYVTYKVIVKNESKVLKIKITEKYKNFYIPDLKKNEDLKETVKTIKYKNFQYELKYNSFAIYDDLFNLFQNKFLNDFLNIKYYKLLIKSNEDYFLKINNKIIGSTNHIYYVEGGKKEISIFKSGYETKNIKLDVNKDTVLQVDLKKVNTKTVLIINTFPQNSEIWIDNKFVGFSPLEIMDIEKGNHFISIIKEGFIIREKVLNIVSGRINNINVFLYPESSLEYFNKYSQKYLDLGYQKAFLSGIFTGLSILSRIMYNEFNINYKYSNNDFYKHLSDGMSVVTVIFISIAIYELYDSLNTFNKYISINTNYNPIE